ncbi:MAG: Lrp/AsnC family transcriptional regulator [Rhodobacteraceae bacterium]|uniref:Lrp/AsnC family transcriptional regulator n=1 Tax=Celeribacter sp. HF31 TaxID=2721558 RepID=UPI0015888AF7|nr:Lrp/AsnC family transcriptional regulator [Celeribacter sp. HF31]NVK46054.1 Lrp/AsnC family transcriptional regulator [Paracoccaceae bacterium]
MDQIDEKILRELARDGRLSNLDLADRIGLSPSATSRRVSELERLGVIRGYRAVIDRDQVGQGFLAYIAVGLSEHNKASQKGFEAAMETAFEVKECHNIAGAFEYLLRVEAADLTAYKRFHTEVLGTVPNVASITSYIVMESPKDLRG